MNLMCEQMKNEKKEFRDLIEAMFLDHDKIEGVLIRCNKIYLTPWQIFKTLLSTIKYKWTGKF